MGVVVRMLCGCVRTFASVIVCSVGRVAVCACACDDMCACACLIKWVVRVCVCSCV